MADHGSDSYEKDQTIGHIERESAALKQIDAALKRIGEITMENELLKAKADKQGPFGKRRSRK